MSDSILDSINKMNREWWTVFHQIESSLNEGNIEQAKFICSLAKKNLKDFLKGEPLQ